MSCKNSYGAVMKANFSSGYEETCDYVIQHLKLFIIFNLPSMVMVYCITLDRDNDFEDHGHVTKYSKKTLVFHNSTKFISRMSSRTLTLFIKYPSLRRQHSRLLKVQVTLSSICFFFKS